MAELGDSLSAILNDPKAMAKLQETAAALFGGQAADEQSNLSENASAALPQGGALGNIGEIGAVMNVINALKSTPCDNRATLLTALKPHLSPKRRERVDKAVKMLRLVSLVPLIKQQGLLNDLL